MPGQETPLSFAFSTAPNPFVKQVKVNYALPKQTHVSAVIYDITGRQVEKLLSGEYAPGYHSKAWDGTDDTGKTVPSGVYFIKFNAGDYCVRNKMLLIK
jgi:flagellar hook assembly protein FlgD